MSKKLTIVIVSFQSSLVIRKCLEKMNFDKYEIIVVDNNSQDETLKIIESEFPKTKIIKSSKNNGFGRANNLVLDNCQTEYALVLNPDAFLFEEDIEKVLAVLDQNPQIALACPLILEKYPMDEKEINARTFQIKSTSNGKNYLEEDFIAGGVLFVRISSFKDHGFFNEEYFMFAEDNELCDKSLALGYKNAVIFEAKAYHIAGTSSKPNMRNRYRRFWHLGWSKSFYRSKRKNFFNSKRATLRLAITYFFAGIKALIKKDQLRIISKFAFSFGCFANLIGLTAFRKDGTPRG